MGCNCGSARKRQTYEVVFNDKNIPIKVYASEVEAKAAVARNGGGTIRAK